MLQRGVCTKEDFGSATDKIFTESDEYSHSLRDTRQISVGGSVKPLAGT